MICSCCEQEIDKAEVSVFDYEFCNKCSDRLKMTVKTFIRRCGAKKDQKRIPIDWDKACALYNAGWDYKQIAEEVGCAESTAKLQIRERIVAYDVGVRYTKHSILEDN